VVAAEDRADCRQQTRCDQHGREHQNVRGAGVSMQSTKGLVMAGPQAMGRNVYRHQDAMQMSVTYNDQQVAPHLHPCLQCLELGVVCEHHLLKGGVGLGPNGAQGGHLQSDV
jgi:hypothetical protein